MTVIPPPSVDAIAAAAERVLLDRQLSGLSLEAVAREAGCAKGLVNYHYKSKAGLLVAVAARLAARRRERLLTALQPVGAAALDALWQALLDAAGSGATAGRAALLGLGDAEVAAPLIDRTDEWHELALGIARALDLDALDPESTRGLLAAFDGLELALLSGADAEETEAAFYRTVLALTA